MEERLYPDHPSV